MIPLLILKKILGLIAPIIKILLVIGLVALAFQYGLGGAIDTVAATDGGQVATAGVSSSMSATVLAQQDTPDNGTETDSDENKTIIERAEDNEAIENPVKVISQAQDAELNKSEAQRVAAWIYAETGQNVDLTSSAQPSTDTPTDSSSSDNSDSQDDSESDNNSTPVWDEQMFRHSSDVVLHDVQYQDGQAIVFISYTGQGEGPKVQVTDSTRSSTGEVPKTVRNLEEGHNRIRVDLTNPAKSAVTIDVEDGRMFLHNKEPPTNWLPDVALGVVVLILGMFSQIGLTSSIELLFNRKNRSPKREI